jgi:hypothetical protein
MARRLRSTYTKVETGKAFEEIVKGMRHEMEEVIWKIESSVELSPESLKSMLKHGLETMVGAVEKAMN